MKQLTVFCYTYMHILYPSLVQWLSLTPFLLCQWTDVVVRDLSKNNREHTFHIYRLIYKFTVLSPNVPHLIECSLSFYNLWCADSFRQLLTPNIICEIIAYDSFIFTFRSKTIWPSLKEHQISKRTALVLCYLFSQASCRRNMIRLTENRCWLCHRRASRTFAAQGIGPRITLLGKGLGVLDMDRRWRCEGSIRT